MFDELIKEITKELEANESWSRVRRDAAQVSFEYAVRSVSEVPGEIICRFLQMNPQLTIRNGYFSELPRYRDSKLIYRQVKAAFDCMIKCRLIEVTTGGA